MMVFEDDRNQPKAQLIEKIERIKNERRCAILAHNYQRAEMPSIAGDLGEDDGDRAPASVSIGEPDHSS